MIQVLVTGANGQLANCIKDLETQYQNINFIYTDTLELDICDLSKVQAFFETNKSIQYCINCAAYTAVDKAETEVEKAFQVNAEGPENLAKACKDNEVILIHISTDFVFDGNHDVPYKEEDTPNPLSVYGASKLKGEEVIKATLNQYFIFRTSWLYSEHGNNFMKTMLRLAETRNELSVVSDQIGTPTYAKDLAEVILKVINSNNQNFGLYHYSNEGVASWYDFAKAVFEFADSKVKLTSITTEGYPTPAERPSYSVLSKDKIVDCLDTNPLDWRESLKVALKSVKS
ncbi:dTDP-4-dehydrorhamnose reductase [Tamlana sp. 2_MG-2023]|uniref:dTDP-4-dehydrorhamnose reductase n=1 Tax=unclassified Tamlana TaxID=2614803 RepID=UPI0026E2315A|nr:MULTISPECIES: dTDP-4-dehydrorhamnose reductase [unclassified Tamlana]MDO6759740.1 dTDP-4-dehydrorhamnose reductase [Tamlana sp. 2_MG-2023]MDO6791363.1 dTDP-4-dehydrorhamnose reductase [Tamlana sp. 1_MG-2023]